MIQVTNKAPDVESLLLECLFESNLVDHACGSNVASTCLFDCRAMDVPDQDDHRVHFGTHPALFRKYWTQGCFTPHIRLLTQKLSECRRTNVRTLTVVVFDEKGRWSAMAVGKAIAEIALRSPGLTMQRVSLFTHHSDWDCGMCDKCEFWSRKWRTSNQTALDIYRLFCQCCDTSVAR